LGKYFALSLEVAVVDIAVVDVVVVDVVGVVVVEFESGRTLPYHQIRKDQWKFHGN